MTRVYRERLHREQGVYHYRDFHVPPGVTGVRVRLSYDRSRGVIDLGAFDDCDGFRGYSGSARPGFAITPAQATPGYLPGPVDAREWSVFLGLHRLPDEGLDYELEIGLGSVHPEAAPSPPPLASRPPPRDLPAARGRRWVAGDLHCHSVHSDGSDGVHALANRARAAGLDFLAITDHNTTSHHAWLEDAAAYSGVELIPAQEVTTERGHASCFGAVGWVDFRAPPDAWLAQAQGRGGLMAVNHPARGDCAWRLPLPAVPLLELWHGSWDRRSHETIDLWSATGTVPVGGSDWHRPRTDARSDHRPRGSRPTATICARDSPAARWGCRSMLRGRWLSARTGRSSWSAPPVRRLSDRTDSGGRCAASGWRSRATRGCTSSSTATSE